MPEFSAHTIETEECTRRFVNGESMSLENCEDLPKFVACKNTLSQVPLLLILQHANRWFVPVVDLDSDAAHESTQFLLEANGRLKAVIRFDDRLPLSVAEVLHRVMSSPQSTITGFCYRSRNLMVPNPLEFAASQKIFERCITDATALEFISGPELVLQWIKRPVPEIRLSEISLCIDDKLPALDLLLGMGGVNKLAVSHSSNETYESVVDAVAKANKSLPPGKCVHEFEVRGCADLFDSTMLEKLVRTLFSIEHLTKLTLSSPNWLTVVPLAELKELVTKGSLQHLEFSYPTCDLGQEKTYLEELGSKIEKNRQRVLEWALGPARALTLTLTNGNEVIEPLARYIAEDRVEDLSAGELTTVSRATEKFLQELKKT